MPIPDAEDPILNKVKKWLAFADEDLQYARHGLAIQNNPPYRLIAYHAQQCVEKHLKAYLVFHKCDFPYSHNISNLLDICSRFATWTEQIRDAEELTPFAITTRYPGEDDDVSLEEASKAIQIAERVRQVVKQGLTDEGLGKAV
ncbi:MAG: HEPN domain-containing protein [Ignavibacteriae bacterium]|nr:HEPN domain-containing protein [Ignavibacteriota bacterium]